MVLSATISPDNIADGLILDQFAALLNQVSLAARVFFAGSVCELTGFDGADGLGHLHVLKAGRCSIRLKGREVALVDQPSVLFFPRPCQHALVPTDPEGVALVCASFDLGATTHSPLADALPDFLVLPLDKASSLASTLDLFFTEAFSDRCGRQAALDRLAEYFLIQLLRHIRESGTLRMGLFAALADARLANAVAAMHDHPGRSWSLEELADVAGMSRSRFANNFRETVGTTPHDYLTDWRLSIVQSQLKKGKSLKAIAGTVGYQSPAALTRVFTSRLGLSPSAWLGQMRATTQEREQRQA